MTPHAHIVGQAPMGGRDDEGSAKGPDTEKRGELVELPLPPRGSRRAVRPRRGWDGSATDASSGSAGRVAEAVETSSADEPGGARSRSGRLICVQNRALLAH